MVTGRAISISSASDTGSVRGVNSHWDEREAKPAKAPPRKQPSVVVVIDDSDDQELPAAAAGPSSSSSRAVPANASSTNGVRRKRATSSAGSDSSENQPRKRKASPTREKKNSAIASEGSAIANKPTVVKKESGAASKPSALGAKLAAGKSSQANVPKASTSNDDEPLRIFGSDGNSDDEDGPTTVTVPYKVVVSSLYPPTLGRLVYGVLETGETKDLPEMLRADVAPEALEYTEGVHNILTAAAATDQSEFLRILLADGRLDPNTAPENRLTPLQWAAFLDNEEAARVLLMDKRTNTDLRNRYGRHAAYYAVVGDSHKVLSLFFERMKLGHKVDFSMPDGPMRAGLDTNVDTLTKPSKKTKMFVRNALTDLKVSLAPLGSWLEIGPPATPQAKFRKLCAEGDGSTVDKLINAIEGPYKEEAEQIILNGIDSIDDNGTTALMHAVWEGHLNIARELLPYVDGDRRDKFGRTALYYACAGNNSAMVSVLLDSRYYEREAEPGDPAVFLRTRFHVDPRIPDNTGRMPKDAEIETIYRADDEVRKLVARAIRDREDEEAKQAARDAASKKRAERALKRNSHE